MTFDIEKYRKYWKEMRDRAVEISLAEVRDQNPLTIGKTAAYDNERKDCMMWEIDDGFIQERMYHDDSLPEAEAAEEYIMSIIKDGPRCVMCLWNDGGPKSCVHPLIEDCKHETVRVIYDWTLYMSGEMTFIGVDWTKGTFQGFVDKDEAGAHDGTRTKVGLVTCLKCKEQLDHCKLDRDLLEAFEDEY